MLEQEIAVEKGPHTIPALGKKGQVLVVDDSRAVLDVLSKLLAFLGYDATVASNGLEGGNLFITGSYDLVITDLQMPLMNGWELSRLVKERNPKTPVVVMTGLCDDRGRRKMSMSCVDAIIPKPFRLEEIDKTLQTLLNSGV